MKSYVKRRLRILKNYAIGWTLAFVFLSIVRGVGTEEVGELKFDFLSSIIISFTIGPIVGLASGYFQLFLEERIYRKISIRKLLILRFVYALGFLIFIVFLAYGVYQLYFGTELDILTFALDEGSFAVYFYVLCVDLFLNVLRQVEIMLGEGNLMKFIQGKFYEPREELRIFMFIDLQSSTTLAEQLGHLQYSAFIQDCFNDLGVVVEHEAEIYQYVGDEAVLTWRLKNEADAHSSLQAFFRFKQQIEERAQYYVDKYGNKPFFKAGVHCGLVTVTEIGKYKKEIAYHGDPVNTAARIQGQCNALGEELLISQDLKDKLNGEGPRFRNVGAINLRGKEKEVSLFSVASEG